MQISLINAAYNKADESNLKYARNIISVGVVQSENVRIVKVLAALLRFRVVSYDKSPRSE